MRTALWMPRGGTPSFDRTPLPTLAPHEIRVKAIASGISTGTELVLYHGLGPGDQAMTPSTCEGRWDLPVKYGYQSVGRVIDAGQRLGLRARATSSSAATPTRTSTRSTPPTRSWCIRIPEFDPPEIGVLGNNADVALTALLDVPVRLGDVVGVAGLGLVGMFCTLLARRTAGKLVVVDPFEYRRDIALRARRRRGGAPRRRDRGGDRGQRRPRRRREHRGQRRRRGPAARDRRLRARGRRVRRRLVRLQADPAGARAAVLLPAPQARELERAVRRLRAAAALGPGPQAAARRSTCCRACTRRR